MIFNQRVIDSQELFLCVQIIRRWQWSEGSRKPRDNHGGWRDGRLSYKTCRIITAGRINRVSHLVTAHMDCWLSVYPVNRWQQLELLVRRVKRQLPWEWDLTWPTAHWGQLIRLAKSPTRPTNDYQISTVGFVLDLYLKAEWQKYNDPTFKLTTWDTDLKNIIYFTKRQTFRLISP